MPKDQWIAANNALFMFFIEHLQREPTCRTYIQVAVITYRNKEYIADDTMAGLERDCGINGFRNTPTS
jgi:hypothetical protein